MVKTLSSWHVSFLSLCINSCGRFILCQFSQSTFSRISITHCIALDRYEPHETFCMVWQAIMFLFLWRLAQTMRDYCCSDILYLWGHLAWGRNQTHGPFDFAISSPAACMTLWPSACLGLWQKGTSWFFRSSHHQSWWPRGAEGPASSKVSWGLLIHLHRF